MGKNLFYYTITVGFFICLLVGTILLTDVFFNSSSSFFDRMSGISNFFKGLGA